MAPLPLHPREEFKAIPTTYSSLNGPSPGEIAGIVLGSVAGFILIAWLIYTSCGGSAAIISDDETVSSVEIRRRKRRHGSRSSRGTPVVERIVIQERTERRSGSRMSGRSRSLGSLEEVVVIEEGSPPPRRSRSQRGGGYREVDPREYGGGAVPMREVRRGSRR